MESRAWVRKVATLALGAVLGSLALRCTGSDRDPKAPPDARPEPDAPAALADDLDADVTPAVLDCRLRCPSDDDAGVDCTQLAGTCTCEAGVCTGGPGVSLAICPYRYRYCVGLNACVTRARYFAQCPY